MDPDIFWSVVYLFLWLIVSGFFSGVETGMYSLNKFRLGALASEGDPEAVRLERLLSEPGDLISALLLGTNIAIYIATARCTSLISGLGEWPNSVYPAVITTLIMSPAVLMFAEMIPKEAFRRRADLLVYMSGRAVSLASLILSPGVCALRFVITGVEWLFGVDREREKLLFSREQLSDLIAVGAREGVIDDKQADMAREVMQFKRKKLRDVMIPVDETAMADKDTDLQTFLDMVRGRRHSRIVVFDKKQTNVVGVVNIFDIFYDMARGKTVEDYVEPAIEMNSDTLVPHALLKLQLSKRMMLLVTEGRVPVGIVTVKDLVEEIVGELSDW